jgi:hypothetical protein
MCGLKYRVYICGSTCLTSKNEIRPDTEKRIATADIAYYALHPILKSQSVYRNQK